MTEEGQACQWNAPVELRLAWGTVGPSTAPTGDPQLVGEWINLKANYNMSKVNLLPSETSFFLFIATCWLWMFFCLFFFRLVSPLNSLRLQMSHTKEGTLVFSAPFGAEVTGQKGGLHPGLVEGMSVCVCEISML